MPKLDITSQQRSALRSAAHPLKPVVLIGDRGLTEAVLKEIDLNLNAHQLIKVRVAGDDRAARIAILEGICETLSCAPVHHLGKTLILYRPDIEAERTRAAAENATRAVRKPSEPHTPKKLAATGASLTRKSEKARKAASRPEKPASPAATAAPRARRAGTSERPAHGIPRRAGSALSLRAGARRGLRGSGKR
jgi:RNA-binding protein